MDITTDFSEEKVQEDSFWVLSCCLKYQCRDRRSKASSKVFLTYNCNAQTLL